MEWSELSDRVEIADLVARYTRAVDTRRWDDLDDLFADGAAIDYTAMGGIAGGLAEVKAYLADTMTLFSVTQHMLGLPAIDVAGDRATAVTPCHNPMVLGEGDRARVMVCALWYHEELVRTAQGWRIASLSEERCHMSFLPAGSDIPSPSVSTAPSKGHQQ